MRVTFCKCSNICRKIYIQLYVVILHFFSQHVLNRRYKVPTWRTCNQHLTTLDWHPPNFAQKHNCNGHIENVHVTFWKCSDILIRYSRTLPFFSVIWKMVLTLYTELLSHLIDDLHQTMYYYGHWKCGLDLSWTLKMWIRFIMDTENVDLIYHGHWKCGFEFLELLTSAFFI
jgi:hypothetical protein